VLRHVLVVRPAQEAEIVGAVSSSVPERVRVVELETLAGGAAPSVLVDEAAAASVPLVDGTPHRRGDVS
jgi:hypothetical protein